MYLIRLFKVGSHLREEFVGADADVDGEAERLLYLVLQAGGHFDGGLRSATEAHIEEAFIDGELLKDGRVAAADGDEPRGTLFVPGPVPTYDDKARAGAKGHRDGLCRLDAEFLGRDGGRRDDAPPVAGVSGDDGGNETDVRSAFPDEFYRTPRKERGIDIDMEDDAGHGRGCFLFLDTERQPFPVGEHPPDPFYGTEAERAH